MRAKGAKHLSFIVIEITILNPTTSDHNQINRLSKFVPVRTKKLAQPTLNFITEGGAFLYLRCNGYRQATLCSVRRNYEQEKMFGVKFTPFLLTPLNIRTSSKPSLWPKLQC